MDVDLFARGFVAALVAENQRSLQPKKPEQVRAFYKIRDVLQKAVDRAREDRDDEWLRQLVMLRNRLAPGPTGSFDQFETALRDLQLSFTESPNVYYEDIEFTVSRPFANSTLNGLALRERTLVQEAATAFLQGMRT